MKTRLTLLIFFLFNALLFAQVFEWEWQNPKPVGNTFNDAVSLGFDNVIAVGHSAIIHRTDDGGISWESQIIDDDGREIESVHFPTPLIGYVAGDDGLLKKTTDGGLTWFTIFSPTDEHLWGIEFVDADTGYVVGGNGAFFKTTNGGNNWTAVTAPMTGTIYALHVLAPNNIFAGASSSNDQVVSQSTDYGVTWNDVTGAVGSSVYDIDFLDANYGWLGCSSNKVFITTDGGASWTEAADFGSSGNYRVMIVDANVGYVVDSGGDVHKTTDAGATWTSTEVSTESLRGLVMANNIAGELVDQIYVVGNYGTAYKSTDDGTSWNPVFEFVYQELQRKIEFVDNQTGYVSGGATSTADNLGYILKTTDGGQTWADIGFNFGFQIYSFAMPSANVMYAGTGNNKMFKTTDGGTSWVEQTSPYTSSTHDFYQTRFADENTGYACGSSGRLMKTTDGGANWVELTSGHGTSTIYDMYLFDAQTLITVGTSAKAYKSTDGGASWTQLFVGTPGSYFSMEFYEANPDIGYIGGYDSPIPTLARTTDGGDTWVPISFPASFEAYSSIWGIGIVDQTTLWLSDVQGYILYSNSAGVSWSVMDPVSQNGLYDIAIQGVDMWLCGSGGSIIKGFSDPAVPVELISFSAVAVGDEVNLSWSTATETNNMGFDIERKSNGANWEKIGFVQGNGTTTELSSYSYIDRPQTSGTLFYRLKQIDHDGRYEYSNMVEVNLAQPLTYSLEQNYPNPFNPATTIKYSIPEAGMVNLKVYDVLGNEIATLVSESLDSGIYQFEFDASGYSSGVYFYELTAGKFKSTKKMLILK
jgi:photosystem II stability/assembly factor-like uncharacterized protein